MFIAPSSFPAKKYKKVTGKEIYSDTLESTAMLEKEKFPQHYFPEVRTPHPHRPGPSPWHGPAQTTRAWHPTAPIRHSQDLGLGI